MTFFNLQISELQSIKDCDFTLTNGDNLNNGETCDINDDEEDSYEISNDLKNCKKQLSSFLTVIKEQQEVLHRCVKLLRAYAKGNLLYFCIILTILRVSLCFFKVLFSVFETYSSFFLM